MGTSSLHRLFGFLLSLFPLTVAAQDTPKFEVFGGYSYLRLSNDSGLESAGLNGWNASAKYNPTARFGLLADFRGDYGQRTMAPYTLFLPMPGNPNPQVITEPGRLHQHTFLFGPEFMVLHHGRWMVNARTLAGVTKMNTLVLPLRMPIQLPFGPNGEPITFSRRTVAGGSAFTGALAASLDYRITDRLSYRIFQPELLLVNFVGATPVHFQISSRIIFTSRKPASMDSSERRFSFGIVAGGSSTDDVSQTTTFSFPMPNGGQEIGQSRFYSMHKDYIVGPMVEFGLLPHVALEVDGLYRPMNFTLAVVPSNDPQNNNVSPSTVVTWEFPVLAKYRVTTHAVKPFAEVGPSFRSSGNLNGTAPSSYGGTVGLGIEAHARKLKLAPVLRYTHWAGEGRYEPHTRRNQLELLVGVSF
jgi:hypothetical protein